MTHPEGWPTLADVGGARELYSPITHEQALRLATAAEDRWVEERDALRAEVLQLRKNLLRTWAAAEVREYDLRKLVEQQREALRDVASCDESGQLCWCDGHYSTREDESGQCVRDACAKARAVLAEEVPS